ncbi:S-formylglutathione hydrolase [Gammaproteobacteria bacterium AS21]
MKALSTVKEFGGELIRYQHYSTSCQCDMTFSVYLPPLATTQAVAAIYWLSGLTCTDDNVRTKAGAQRYAAEHGVALVMPDTSPRGDNVANDDAYDLGQGAGFYINATQSPWQQHYQMYDYINIELAELITQNLPIIADKKSIFGHSMGGHGAMISAIKNPGMYQSVSAFSPICHPIVAPWGKGCFSQYLGDNQADWQAWDSTELIKANGFDLAILIDQGAADNFLHDQLFPNDLVKVCKDKNVALELRMQPGYDHSYHFIASFIGEHIAYHAKALNK